MKKRSLLLYIIMVCCVIALSGCRLNGGYEGKDLVDRAKKMHTELEAAHIIVEDISKGRYANEQPVQEIWYRFQGDVMQYMYIGRDLETGEEYYEFNNGTELDTWHTGDTEWSAVAKGSEDYYSYSRTKRHYFADGELLLNDYAAAVSSSEIREEPSTCATFASTVVHIEYDDDKLSQYGSMAGITGLVQEYRSYDTGDFGFMEDFITGYTKDGVQYKYLMRINQTDPSAPIERIELPISSEITENEQ